MHCNLIHVFSGACMLSGAAGGIFSFGSAHHQEDRRDTPQTPTFDIARVQNPHYERNGTRALLHAFAKFNWPLSQARPGNNTVLIDSKFSNAAPGQTTSIRSVPQPYGSEYLSLLTIGTPPQNFHLDLDTGSADFWVFSGLQPDAQTKNRKEVFRIAQSSTWKPLDNASWLTQYGDQSGAEGLVGTDVVTVGDISIAKQAVEVAKTVSDAFIEDPASAGIVGLGFNNINSIVPKRQLGLFDNLKSKLAQPLFAVDMRQDGSGTFQFGYVNDSYSAISRIGIDPSKGYWQFESPVFSVSGIQTRRSSQASPAIADTGTSLILADPQVVLEYYRKVPGAFYSGYEVGYVFPCGTTLPSLGVAVGDPAAGGRLIQISPNLMSFAPLPEGNLCYGSVQSNGGNGLQVFGDVFFRSAYVVFYGYQDDPQLGVVQKN